MARLFYLENEIGDRKELNGAENIWLKNPSGLGINLSGSFADIRKGFFTRISGNIEPQGEIVGDFEFRLSNDPYEDYRDLVDWMAQDYELYFVYNPYGEREFYRTIEINYFTKTEKEFSGLLYINFSFNAITPWYDFTPIAPSIDVTEYKTYDFEYNYIYPTALLTQNINVSAIGHIPAAYTVGYSGYMVNPSIKIIGNDTGAIFGQCDVTAIISPTDSFSYSSRYGDTHIQKTDSSGTVTNLIENVDISKEVFGRIPLTEICTLTITTENVLTATDVEIFDYYRSV